MIRLIIFVLALVLTMASTGYSANYTLEITQPQPSLNTNNRYYKAYPGIPYEVPIGVFGGLYPFTYALINAPSGMTINADTGIITWPNPTTSGSPHSVYVRVTDDEGSTDTVIWTITVATSGFVFLDVNAAEGGNGTIGSPHNSLEDIWGTNGLLTTYDNHFLYFRGGTYGIEGGQRDSCPGQQCRVYLDLRRHPHVWMAYPGEDVTIDHNLAANSNGLFIAVNGEFNDTWFSGLTFRDMRNHGIRTAGGGARQVFYDNVFFNLGPGADGDNSSFIMLSGSGLASTPSYVLIKDNLFDTLNIGAFVKTYSTNKMVIEGNTLQNPSGSPVEGLALKRWDQYLAVRNNTVIGRYNGGSIGGNWADGRYWDISFNNIIDGEPTSNGGYGGALRMNNDSRCVYVYIYRNTVDGTVNLRGGATGNGPFYLYNNVIVSNEAGTPSGSHVTLGPGVTDPSVLVLGTGANANLAGYPADGIIDEYGDLTSTYAAYLGTHGYQTTEAVCSPTRRHLCDVSNCETTGGGYWYNDTCNASPQGVLVNGACGSNDGATLSSLTSDDNNNCSAGTLANFSGTGPWTWSCDGISGGTDDYCSASISDCASDASLCTSAADCTANWPTYNWCTDTCQAAGCPGGGTGTAPYSPTNFVRYSATSFAPFNP